MLILNIQITNASLLDIEGGIGTGVDNGAWVSTAYLIGEIVVIPLTDYLSRVFSFRKYVLANAILFPLFSIACSNTSDLGSMILMRGLQGFTGGILIPVAFTMVLTKLPKHQQSIGLAIFAIAVTFAPAIGTTIGGYLIENYGWRTIFYINALPSAVMVVALAATLDPTPMRLGLLREGDWAGIFTMAIGLASFQTVLEEGNKDDWFSSPLILRLAVLAAVMLSCFVAIELVVKKPVVNLRLLKERNFGIGVVANTLVGFALFGTVYILPQYLGQVQHYNAEQIGNVLAWTGLRLASRRRDDEQPHLVAPEVLRGGSVQAPRSRHSPPVALGPDVRPWEGSEVSGPVGRDHPVGRALDEADHGNADGGAVRADVRSRGRSP